MANSTKKTAATVQKVGDEIADEIREVGENLRGPVHDLVTDTIDATFAAVGTVTSHVANVVGAVAEEVQRIGDRVQSEAGAGKN